MPDSGWRPLVENFGYSLGFSIVVLSRQQLFSENTITAVPPVIVEKSLANFGSMLRPWGVVLIANTASIGLHLSFTAFVDIPYFLALIIAVAIAGKVIGAAIPATR